MRLFATRILASNTPYMVEALFPRLISRQATGHPQVQAGVAIPAGGRVAPVTDTEAS